MKLAKLRVKPFHAPMSRTSRIRRPPFAALLAFDAIARHGSVTAAADELALTQSAVSHRLRALEQHYGVALLERLNPGLRLTPEGRRLAQELGPLLGRFERLDDTVVAAKGRQPFRLGVGQALLAWWLSQRLPALMAAFPDLAIEIRTFTSQADVNQRGIDVALVWMQRHDVQPCAHLRLFPDETVFPVAAPKLIRGAGTVDRGAQWQALPLIDKQWGDNQISTPEWSWTAWLDPDNARPSAVLFRDIAGALQCAVDGGGVALARSLLVTDALRRKKLVRLVRPMQAKPCSKVQVARWSSESHPAARDIANWMVHEAS
jgi:LysR family transcriptional regulator, glycine cleavage system transcriptional activator